MTVAASSNALVAVNDYLTYTGVTDLTDEKHNRDQLQVFINAASQIFQDQTSRKWITPSSAIIEKFDGDGSNTMMTKNRPIASITSIEYWNGSSWQTVDSSSYPYTHNGSDEDGCTVWFTKGNVFWTSDYRKPWRITYSYGYTQANIPDDIKRAIYQMVHRMNMKAEGLEGKTSEAIADMTTSYDLKSLISGDIKEIIDRHKRYCYG
jgi:hypothetical protein